jgi:ribosomal protein L40E
MEISRHWRLKAQRYRLKGAICSSCGAFIFPPRPVCKKCQYTAQTVRIINWALPVNPAWVQTFDIESRIKYETQKGF